MKVKRLIPFLAAILLVNVLLPLGVSAESLDELEQKEAQATSEGKMLSSDITTALNDVNVKYAEIEKLKTDISKAEETIKSSESEIEKTEQSIAKRKEVIGDRMKDLQLNGEQRTWQVLLDAENITDFFNKAYAMTVLQNAEKEKINSLSKEKEKLSELQETVKTKQTELQTNESKLQQEATTMSEQVASLKQQLANNQSALQQIANKKETEEQRIASEKAAEEARKQAEESEAAKAKEAATTAVSSDSNSNSQKPAIQEETAGATNSNGNQPATSTGGGKVLYMQSTAYSWREPGSGFITATGIDLRSESNVIAVDKTVIPLGSFVEVEGYGYAIAGDTGGAIKGNIIDVHFPTVEQCKLWGRRYNVKVVIQ